MSEIIGKITSSYKFLGCNNNVKSRENLIKHSPVMTFRSSAAGGRRLVQQRGVNTLIPAATPPTSDVKMSSGIIGKSVKWWEKGLQPNIKDVTGAEDLVDSLLNAGDKLLVVGFFSPGCGGCKALHPKICQLAEMNPDVQFLLVNYEEHKSMCYSLNVHVLPFFRFYRGAQGRVCSFSCTNATIKKFRDALAKHTPDRCSLGPTKGLEEKELLALDSNRDLSFSYSPNPNQPQKIVSAPELIPASQPEPPSLPLPLPLPCPLKPVSTAEEDKNRNLVSFGK